MEGEKKAVSTLSREQQHWRGVRRSLWATLVAFAFGGLAFLGGYFDFRLLTWIAYIGIVGCFGYIFSMQVELFRVWFIRRKKW